MSSHVYVFFFPHLHCLLFRNLPFCYVTTLRTRDFTAYLFVPFDLPAVTIVCCRYTVNTRSPLFHLRLPRSAISATTVLRFCRSLRLPLPFLRFCAITCRLLMRCSVRFVTTYHRLPLGIRSLPTRYVLRYARTRSTTVLIRFLRWFPAVWFLTFCLLPFNVWVRSAYVYYGLLPAVYRIGILPFGCCGYAVTHHTTACRGAVAVTCVALHLRLNAYVTAVTALVPAVTAARLCRSAVSRFAARLPAHHRYPLHLHLLQLRTVLLRFAVRYAPAFCKHRFVYVGFDYTALPFELLPFVTLRSDFNLPVTVTVAFTYLRCPFLPFCRFAFLPATCRLLPFTCGSAGFVVLPFLPFLITVLRLPDFLPFVTAVTAFSF